MARLAQSSPIKKLVSQLDVRAIWLNVIGLQFATALTAKLACIIVAFVHRLAPRSILRRCHISGTQGRHASFPCRVLWAARVFRCESVTVRNGSAPKAVASLSSLHLWPATNLFFGTLRTPSRFAPVAASDVFNLIAINALDYFAAKYLRVVFMTVPTCASSLSIRLIPFLAADALAWSRVSSFRRAMFEATTGFCVPASQASRVHNRKIAAGAAADPSVAISGFTRITQHNQKAIRVGRDVYKVRVDGNRLDCGTLWLRHFSLFNRVESWRHAAGCSSIAAA